MTYNFEPKKLIACRKTKFWTQEDLAAASGVSVRTIQRIEREGGGSLESWKALAAAFNAEIYAFEAKPDKTILTEKDIKYGRAGLMFATIWSVGGCVVPWAFVIMGFSRGVGLEGLWPFVVLGVSLTGICATILTWGWRRFFRMIPPVSFES